MNKITFKQYNDFVSADDLSEEQVSEIFGKFFGRDESQMDQLNAKKAELKKAADAKKKEIDKKKDELWAKAKQGSTQKPQGSTPSNSLMSKSTSNMKAGERRAVDRDPFGLTFESNLEEAVSALAQEALGKICLVYSISMAAARAIFLGGSSSDMVKAQEKLVAAGYDEAATTYRENQAFYKNAGLNKSHYNALVKASISESVDFVFESAMSDIYQDIEEIWKDLTSGKLDLLDILSGRDSTDLSAPTRKWLQYKYDSIATEHHLHADDDFEEITQRMMDELEQDMED